MSLFPFLPTKAPRRRSVCSLLLIVGIALAGFGVRMALVHLPGYEFDVSVNQKWSKSAVEFGLAESYHMQVEGNMLPNYPPLSMEIFALTAWIYRVVVSPDLDITAPSYDIWIKMPSILADIALVVALWWILRRRNERIGLAAAALYAFQPAVFYNSAVWGQTDALFTLPLFLGITALGFKRPWVSGILLSMSILIKFQAIAVFPILLLCIRDPKTLCKIFLGALLTACVVLLPFASMSGLHAIGNVYTDSIGYYHTISVGAYNFWWSLLGDSAWSSEDTSILLSILDYHRMGYILFGSAIIWIMSTPRLWRKQAKICPEDLLLCAALLALGFFLFNTQMHERYAFPFVALALPAAVLHRNILPVYLVVSLGIFGNLLGVLPWGTFDRMLFAEFGTIDVFIATVLVCAFVLLVTRFRQMTFSK